MKNSYIRYLLMFTKYSMYGVLIQCLFLSTLLAHDGAAQVRSIREVKITLSLSDMHVQKAFEAIESRTEYRFVYDRKELTTSMRVTVSSDDKTVADILSEISTQTGLEFKQINKNISVKHALTTPEPPQSIVFRSISGTVISSDDKQPLPGVNILVKGTTTGTVTDVNGQYSIEAPDGATLVFTSIGYKAQEILVGNQSVIDVTMEIDISTLEEIVVIGYGTAKKSELTGAVASVSGEDLKKIPVSGVAESLTGRMAGVQVTTTEGSPDAEVRIRVRGGGSITQDNTPLYIVDGFPVTSITDISPSDIKSIDVLKDASSTAIYGSRGANGVIIITTKGGNTDGRVSVSYNTFFGVKRIAKTLDVLGAQDFVRWQHEYAVLRDNLSSFEDYFGTYQDIDLYAGLPANNWQKQVYGRTGQVFSNDLSVRGGSDKFNYSANFARFDEKAIQIGSDFLRNNFTLKLNNKPNDKIELAFSLRYSDAKVNGGGSNEQNEVSSADSRLKHAVSYSPIPVDGITTGDDTDDQTVGDLVNPIVATYDNDRYQERRNYNMGASFVWNITDNIQWRSDFGYDTYQKEDDRFYGLSTYMVKNRPAAEFQNMPALVMNNTSEIRYRNTNTVQYDFKNKLGDNHHLRVLLGEEMLKTELRTLVTEIHGFPTLFTFDEALKLTTQGQDIFSVDNNYSPDEKLLSFFGRVNYDYRGKILVSGTYRADGSSLFLGDNRWGFFPSVAAAWKVSDEAFMQSTSNWLNSLKLRASFGTAGNNRILTGQISQIFESNNTTWMNGYTSFWAPSKRLANPDLKWETTHTRNLGVDFSVLKGRLSGTVELYDNNTSDLLIEFPIPGSGYDTQFRNMGETQNKGIETSLNYVAIDKQDYGLSFSFNIAFNRNEVKSLGVMEDFGVATGWASTQIPNDFLVARGQPIGTMYGYRNDGRYEVSDFEGYNDATNTWILKAGVANSANVIGTVAPGMMKLQDLTGDGVVNQSDQTIIGDANPKHTGGFIVNGYAYGFDLTAAFNWSFGNSIYNANKIEFTTANQNNQYRNLIDMQAAGNRWNNIDEATGQLVTDPETLADMNASTTMWSPYMRNYVFSDWAVEDGSFLRLNTLTLGYSVPSNLTSRIHLKSLRFYVTGYNVFILTDYTGFDPEVSTRRKTPLTPGVDYSAYPRSRQVVFGMNLNF